MADEETQTDLKAELDEGLTELVAGLDGLSTRISTLEAKANSNPDGTVTLTSDEIAELRAAVNTVTGLATPAPTTGDTGETSPEPNGPGSGTTEGGDTSGETQAPSGDGGTGTPVQEGQPVDANGNPILPPSADEGSTGDEVQGES